MLLFNMVSLQFNTAFPSFIRIFAIDGLFAGLYCCRVAGVSWNRMTTPEWGYDKHNGECLLVYWC